jgi:hypothetical protein
MMRRTIRLVVVAQVLLGLPLAACDQNASPPPPWGLDAVTQPSDEVSVTRVLEAMPTAVAGRERAASSDPFRVSYGERGHAGLRALPLGEAAEAEGFPATAGDYLRTLADSGEVEIETQRLDPRSGLVYVVGTTTVSTEVPGGATINETTEFLIGWGEPDSEWLFAISADSPEIRIALVEAFVDAVESVNEGPR